MILLCVALFRVCGVCDEVSSSPPFCMAMGTLFVRICVKGGLKSKTEWYSTVLNTITCKIMPTVCEIHAYTHQSIRLHVSQDTKL